MTTVSTLAQSLSAHPGPWNGGHGWFPFFGFFIVANVLARRSAIGRVGEVTGPCPPSRRD